eukprot:g4237.t1
MIEFLSGKSVPNKAAAPPPQRMDNTGSSFRGNDRGAKQKSREMQKILQLMQQYEVLLNFLKQHGALLSSVRPEHFLSHEYYLQYQQSLNVGITRRQVDKIFFPKSMEAWLTSLLQTVKIFLLNRVTHKAFKTLPGMSAEVDQPVGAPVGVDDMDLEVEKKNSPELQGALDQKFLADSNVYSISECILLRWLNFHFARANRDRYSPRKVCCFDSDLEDSIVLAVVIQSHVPHCQAVQNMRPQCSNLDHHEENAMHILAALSEIGLQFPIQVSDIASPQAKDLPACDTTIIFSTMLGVNMTKNIELTNPSKKAISYGVQLVGSGHNSGSDFAIKDEIVKLEPRQTVSFPVEFHSRFSRRYKKANSSTCKYLSAGQVGTVDVELENPFNEDAEFSVALRESTCCDAEKHPVASKRSEGMEAFYLSVTRCRVKAGGTGKITVSFLPFEAPAHFTALLGVFDSKAGEYYYELFGTSSPPLPLENYKMQVKAEASGTKDPAVSSPYYTAPKQVVVHNGQAVNREGKGDGKGASRSGTNGALEKGDRRSSAVAKAIGLPQQVAKLVIPIVNPTDREWAIKPTFSQIGHEFDGPREFIAKKKGATGQATVTTYPLTFKPDWVCDVKAQLVLYNVGTNETYEYDLHGVAEEPLAEEHVVVKCEAREKTSHVFQVKNHSNLTAAFEVESDLVHISGPSSIQVDGRGTGDYELTFQPLQAGQVTGCIIFRDTHTGHFTWYTVELMTLPPKPQQHLTLTCVVRQAVAVDIQLVNPLDDVVVFEVALTGDGLLGEAEFVLAPKETATYELVFSPLLPARSKGTAVFFNEIVGEFWYDLSLLAEAAPAEEIAPLECELGRTAQTVVHIDNPTGQEVVLKHRSTNKINFKVLNNRVVLPPLESTDITIEYSPSSLGVTEEAQIVFEHPLVGQWVYKAQGLGLPPLEARHVTVAAQVNRTVSSTIQFKNPFLETITIFIVLESKSEKGVFNLLSKKAKVQIGPLATTQIPFSFCPPTMTQHTAEIALSVMKPNLSWSYRIQGVAEAPADPTLHTFMVQAREALQTTYALTLIGLDTTPGDTHGDQLSCQLEVPPQHQAMVSKCFDISLDSDATAARASSQASRTRGKSDGQVFLKVNFSPLRPFIALCNLVITRASGGRWRFDLKLEATEPEVDDVISIHVIRSREVPEEGKQCEGEAALEVAAAAATDLSTYWSNSVRPYALRGSPFLRRPVFASLWRLTLRLKPRESSQGTQDTRVSARLKASQARRFLEIQLSGDAQHLLLSGSAWCTATNPEPKFSQVVVPPVPLAPEEMEAAVRRFKAMERRPRLSVVKAEAAESAAKGVVASLSLTLDSEDGTADELAGLYGRKTPAAKTPLDANACGDLGPVLSKALRLAVQNAGMNLAFCSIEVEMSAVPVGAEIELLARAEKAGEAEVVLVTGWLAGKDVLRVLEPAGTNGTTFVVTYKPTEYGKPVQGKLIIQTEDVFWSYLVKGTHPKYTAPVVEKPKVATRLTKEMEMQLAKASQSRRKNFIKETWKRTFFAT